MLSADRHMLARPHQQQSILASGLKCVFLGAKWSQSRRHEQAAYLLWWWPRIELALVGSPPGGQFWIVPNDFDSGELRLLRFNPAQDRKRNS